MDAAQLSQIVNATTLSVKGVQRIIEAKEGRMLSFGSVEVCDEFGGWHTEKATSLCFFSDHCIVSAETDYTVIESRWLNSQGETMATSNIKGQALKIAFPSRPEFNLGLSLSNEPGGLYGSISPH